MIPDTIFSRAAAWWVSFLFPGKEPTGLSQALADRFRNTFVGRDRFEIRLVANVACCPTAYLCPAILLEPIRERGLVAALSRVPVRMAGTVDGILVDVGDERRAV